MGKDRGIGGWQQAYGKLHLSLNTMGKKWLLIAFLSCCLGLLKAQEKRVFQLSQFVFEDTAGRKFFLDSLKGKTVFVDCWFPSCPPCRAEMPYSQLLQKRLHTMQMDSNIVFVTISFRQSSQDWLDMMKKLPMPNAIHLYSPAATYEATFAPEFFPTYRVFNNKGELDNVIAPKPSDFGKIDFVLFAATRGVGVYEAEKIYLKGKAITERGLNMQKNVLYEEYEKGFSQYAEVFKKEFDGVKAGR
jgi:thiol-disulfide isomerase/thioredoxin